MSEFYGDHPALDLMNTVMQINGGPADSWQSAQDVMKWLADAGFPAGASVPAGLLEAARQLRETVRGLINARKHGEKLDVAPLNALLAQAQRHLELVPALDGSLQVAARYAADTPQRLLAPLAESAATLLAEGDFSLVRKCEDEQCTLWFLDRTKSHRRRWCSMALCGNRHKVASFRQRQKA
jgi:predicted RNA-binding Zn ribbon-like protein